MTSVLMHFRTEDWDRYVSTMANFAGSGGGTGTGTGTRTRQETSAFAQDTIQAGATSREEVLQFGYPF